MRSQQGESPILKDLAKARPENEPNDNDATQEDDEIKPVSPGYLRYALVLLLIIFTLNYIDRQIINILAEPIKQELGLADWQLGVMTGLAFAVFYSLLGIPIARFAEYGNRPLIISLSIGFWSAFTVLCGVARNFVQLVLVRVGVGVGEAGCAPAALSLISDYAPKQKRASAIAFFSIGTPLGFLIGTTVGGLIADMYGWRVAFYVAGAPGILIAFIAYFTLREPRAAQALQAVKTAENRVNFRDAMKLLYNKKTYWLIVFGFAIKSFISYGHSPFTASFFLRNHAEEIASLAAQFNVQSIGFLGLALGGIGGTAGVIGTFLGGYLADRFSKNDIKAYVTIPAVASLVTIPLYISAILVGSAVAAIFLLALQAVVNALWFGPVFATAQTIVPRHVRATATAVLMLVVNLIGLGLGPVGVGLMSDIFAHQFNMGEGEGLRWSLIVSTFPGFLAAYLFWRARRTVVEETEQ
ncbi:spinster family MFS transporter [Hyphococcus sp. DH-69]|uniref:spinster family MFS transporter n=1 Tax=Hyphococcus formosus TaxID=3143534 RepID=UPI00398AC75D